VGVGGGRVVVGAGELAGAGEGDRTGTGTGVGDGAEAGARERTGAGAGTLERREAGRTEAGAVDGTTLGAGGERGARTAGGPRLDCSREYDSEADSFTTTGVPTGELSKKRSAIPWGRRMQPCEAA